LSSRRIKKARKVSHHAEVWEVAPIRIQSASGWSLCQRAPTGRSAVDEKPKELARITGWRSDIALSLLVDCVRRAGYDPESIAARVRPYLLPEIEAYRLALAFRLCRRTDSPRQAERIIRALRKFEDDEAYLWYSYLLRAGRNGGESKLAMSLANLGEVIG